MQKVIDVNIVNVDLIVYWDILHNKCRLCKQPLLMPVFDPVENEMNSNVYFGKCKHYFHEYCINSHLKTHTTCPLDNIIWSLDKRIPTLPVTVCK